MTRNQIKSGISFAGVIIFLTLYGRYRSQELINKLHSCSYYTISKPVRAYKRNWMPRLTYSYTIKSQKIEETESVGVLESGSIWGIDLDELSHKRLLVQVYCKDLNKHKILWDITIPDTLQYIPANGWKEIPYGLGEEE